MRRLQNTHTANVDGVAPKAITTVADHIADRMLKTGFFVDIDAAAAATLVENPSMSIEEVEADKARRNAEAAAALASFAKGQPEDAAKARIAELEAEVIELRSKLSDEAEMTKLLDEAGNRVAELEERVATFEPKIADLEAKLAKATASKKKPADKAADEPADKPEKPAEE